MRKVKFISASKEQTSWGGNNCPYKAGLVEGQVYIVTGIDVRSSHTKITLEGIEGKFNSVCFEKIHETQFSV